MTKTLNSRIKEARTLGELYALREPIDKFYRSGAAGFKETKTLFLEQKNRLGWRPE